MTKISINFCFEFLPWCGVDIVMGVCLNRTSQEAGGHLLPQVLSQEITDLIKSPPSPSSFSTSSITLLYLFPLYLSLSIPCLHFNILSSDLHITHIFNLARFSLTFLFSIPPRPPPPAPTITPPLSPPLPCLYRSYWADPTSCSWVLLKLQLCQLASAAELYQSPRDPVTLGVPEEEMQDTVQYEE